MCQTRNYCLERDNKCDSDSDYSDSDRSDMSLPTTLLFRHSVDDNDSDDDGDGNDGNDDNDSVFTADMSYYQFSVDGEEEEDDNGYNGGDEARASETSAVLPTTGRRQRGGVSASNSTEAASSSQGSNQNNNGSGDDDKIEVKKVRSDSNRDVIMGFVALHLLLTTIHTHIFSLHSINCR